MEGLANCEPRPRLHLVHWNQAEAQARAALLTALGYDVAYELPNGPPFLRALRAHPPAAVVVDLSRLPSQGRDVAVSIRYQKALSRLPLVFVGGEATKLERLQALLPDATYTTWEKIGPALALAIARPPTEPVRPASVFAGYAGKPLTVKLGIKPQTRVVLIGAPEGLEETIGALPAGVHMQRESYGVGADYDLYLWFVRSCAELRDGIAAMADRLGRAALWIAWPKRASGVATDLTQPVVREVGLATGLVDSKICAIDAVWSGLLFTRRKTRGA